MVTSIHHYDCQILPPGTLLPVNVGYPETNVPGISNIIIAPINMIWSLRQILLTTSIDREGFNEAVVHLTACFAGLAYAIESLVSLIDEFVHSITPYLHIPLHATASFLCLIELLLESFRTVRTLLFRNQFDLSPDQYQCLADAIDKAQVEKLLALIESKRKSWEDLLPLEALKKIDEDLNAIRSALENNPPNDCKELAQNLQSRVHAIIQYRNLQIIERDYFTLSRDDDKKIADMRAREAKGTVPVGFTEQRQNSILLGKSVQLARRVQPWLYEKIKDNKDRLLESLLTIITAESPIEQLESIEHTKKLFTQIDKQMSKTLIIHAVALVAIGVISVGITLSFLSVPFFPLIIGIVGGCLAMTASTLKSCTLPVEDWGFCRSYLIPVCLRSYFLHEQIKAE